MPGARQFAAAASPTTEHVHSVITKDAGVGILIDGCPTLELSSRLGHGSSMTFSTKDKIALPVSILLGAVFAYITMVTGGIVIAAVYAIFVIPLVAIFVAGERKILVWQSCLLSFAICGTAMAKAGDAFFPFWTIPTALSSPVPVFFFWERTKLRKNHQVLWVLCGLPFVAVLSIFWLDPFVTVAFLFLWLLFSLAAFGFQWTTSPSPTDARTATLAAGTILVAALGTLTLSAAFRKQQLFRAAMNHHHIGLARFLVRMGADPSKPDARGMTALAEAAWDNVGDLEGTKALLSMGAHVNGRQPGDFNGLLAGGTALDAAASADRGQICDVLIEAGADLNVKNQYGKTPLLVALSHNGIHCVPALLNHGADPTLKDQGGRTALMFLTNYDADDPVIQSIARFLVAHGVDCNARDSDGKTAEDWAIAQKRDKWAYELRRLSEMRRQNR